MYIVDNNAGRLDIDFRREGLIINELTSSVTGTLMKVFSEYELLWWSTKQVRRFGYGVEVTYQVLLSMYHPARKFTAYDTWTLL